jgi:hypothetical protein
MWRNLPILACYALKVFVWSPHSLALIDVFSSFQTPPLPVVYFVRCFVCLEPKPEGLRRSQAHLNRIKEDSGPSLSGSHKAQPPHVKVCTCRLVYTRQLS